MIADLNYKYGDVIVLVKLHRGYANMWLILAK